MKTLNPKIQKAIAITIEKHKDQNRKGTPLPYSMHPISLAMLLMEHSFKEEQIIAALLHDMIEDTDMTYGEIEEEFGIKVMTLVRDCTEQNRHEKWEQRKTATLDKFQALDIDAKWIVLVDKLHNLYSMYQQSLVDEDVFTHFSRPKEKQQWYYDSLYRLFEGEEDIKRHVLFKSFKEYYRALFTED
jgi:(p)ppGpp synthase/HD superfamily hydrolase